MITIPKLQSRVDTETISSTLQTWKISSTIRLAAESEWRAWPSDLKLNVLQQQLACRLACNTYYVNMPAITLLTCSLHYLRCGVCHGTTCRYNCGFMQCATVAIDNALAWFGH